jgi:hypothetical protein
MKPPPPILYKYGKRTHIERLIEHGEVSFGKAEGYLDQNLSEGQQDNEIERSLRTDPENFPFKAPYSTYGMRNLNWKFMGRDNQPLTYYMWCCSFIYDDDLFDEFRADSVAIINNPKLFSDRLVDKARRKYPGRPPSIPPCDIYGRDIVYIEEGKIPLTNSQVDLIFTKNHNYSHQQESQIYSSVNSRHDS